LLLCYPTSWAAGRIPAADCRRYTNRVHEHTFEARDGGTLTRDHVRYAVPLNFLLHHWFVRPDIERIFQFRAESLQKRFAAPLPTQG